MLLSVTMYMYLISRFGMQFKCGGAPQAGYTMLEKDRVVHKKRYVAWWAGPQIYDIVLLSTHA